MRNSETGEFELVVGNSQLLSGFFIGVVLLGVVFALGYVVGQNSPRTAKLAVEASGAGGATSGDARPQPASPAAPPPAAAAAQPPTETASDAEPQPSTQPARDATAPVAGPALVPQAELPAGSFWQLSAVKQPAAEVMRQTLRDKGFPVLLSPAPNNLVRVLVGPYNDTATMGRAKADLEKAGFPTPIKK